MSWIIINKATGTAICELFHPANVARINADKYRAVPVLEYLYKLNNDIKSANQPIKSID